jgi:hypothetical protein
MRGFSTSGSRDVLKQLRGSIRDVVPDIDRYRRAPASPRPAASSSSPPSEVEEKATPTPRSAAATRTEIGAHEADSLQREYAAERARLAEAMQPLARRLGHARDVRGAAVLQRELERSGAAGLRAEVSELQETQRALRQVDPGSQRAVAAGDAAAAAAGRSHARQLWEMRDEAEGRLDADDPVRQLLESMRGEAERLERLAQHVALLPEWIDYDAELEAAHARINQRRIEKESTPITAEYVAQWNEELDAVRDELWNKHSARLGVRLAVREAGASEETPEDVAAVEAVAASLVAQNGAPSDSFQQRAREVLR